MGAALAFAALAAANYLAAPPAKGSAPAAVRGATRPLADAGGPVLR